MQLVAKGSHVVVRAPAKINFFLEVLDRRADGFHEIETVMSTSTSSTRCSFDSDPSGEVHFRLVRSLGTVSLTTVPDPRGRSLRCVQSGGASRRFCGFMLA